MLILEYEAVEVDFCSACAGIWLDAGELELLFGERDIAQGFLSAGQPAKTGESVRDCPICRKPMDKHATASPCPVIYDHCPDGDGLWFDEGELATVLERGSNVEGGAAVTEWLRSLFAEPNAQG